MTYIFALSPQCHKETASHSSLLVFRFSMLCSLFFVFCTLLLTGCASTEQGAVPAGVGAADPQIVVTNFLDDFNKALRDSQLDTRVRQRYWSDLLASYFAPSERVDQRQNMAQALYTFASGVDQLETDQKMVVEVTYSSLELANQVDDRASVRLVDGTLHLRIVRISDQKTLSDVQRPFDTTIGQHDNVLPLVRLNGSWFLTEG